MDLFFVFLVIVFVTSPSETKTMEEVEKELDFLKMEVESLKTNNNNVNEKARNDTEERLSYLEEMSKLNVIRTCEEMFQFGVTESNYYFVDPDGPLTGAEPFRVFCRFESGVAVTEVLHNSEDLIEVGHCVEPGCYSHKIIYSAPDAQIQSLIALSMECEQTVRYDCLLAPLMANDINFGFWLDKNGESNIYWVGQHKGDHVCSCFYQEEGCLDQDTKLTKCNCDAAVPVMTQDMGSITNKTALPITGVQFGGLEYEMQEAFHSLGRLRCWGKAAYEQGTSCAAIKRSGQYKSGFFNIRKNEMENSQLVFCNQTATPGYEDNSESEQFIESSEDHFDIVQKEMETMEENISTNEGQISANEGKISTNEGKISTNEGDISTNEGKISTLEDDVTNLQLKTSYCGYRLAWASATVVTYESLLLDDNNVDGASFNIATGQFTAGVTGVYSVDLSIGRMFPGRHVIYLRLNGVNIPESEIDQQSTDDYEAGGRSMLVNMAKDDTLEVYGQTIHQILYVTFCVSLT